MTANNEQGNRYGFDFLGDDFARRAELRLKIQAYLSTLSLDSLEQIVEIVAQEQTLAVRVPDNIASLDEWRSRNG